MLVKQIFNPIITKINYVMDWRNFEQILVHKHKIIKMIGFNVKMVFVMELFIFMYRKKVMVLLKELMIIVYEM